MRTGTLVVIMTYDESTTQATVIGVERISIDYSTMKLMLRGVLGYIGLSPEGKSSRLRIL